MSILVTKADGIVEPFDPSKLVSSLRRAGADSSVAHGIASDIEKELWSGITTQEIYTKAFSRMREHKRGVAARYSLKRAVMEFGPSGFPFEAYIAELFRSDGYTAEIDQLIQGACVEHEVDVVIHKPGETMYTEAKFHNTVGFHTDLKTVLYVEARMADIRKKLKNTAGHPANHIISGLVVTNTKFTDKAVQYAQCQGLLLLGWEYPDEANLHDKIEAANLYPVTALTTLSAREKTALLSSKIVLCKSIPQHTRVLEELGVNSKRAAGILEEVGALCRPQSEL